MAQRKVLDDYLPEWVFRTLPWLVAFGILYTPEVAMRAYVGYFENFRGADLSGLPHGLALHCLSAVVAVVGGLGIIAAHETGHAVVARRHGLDVPSVCIGTGRQLAKFRCGVTTVELRALPTGGHTVVTADKQVPSAIARRWVAAGPLVHVPLALLCLPFLAEPSTSALVAAGFLFVNVAVLIENLLIPVDGHGGRPGNDAGMLRLLRRSGTLWPPDAATMFQTTMAGPAEPAIALLEQRLDDPQVSDDHRRALQQQLAGQLMRADRFTEAAAVFEQLRRTTFCEHRGRFALGWAFASLCHAAVSGAELDRTTIQEYEDALAASDVPGGHFVDAVLALARGDHDRAEALARQHLSTTDELVARGEIAGFVALTMARRGDAPSAKAWLHDAARHSAFAQAAERALAATP